MQMDIVNQRKDDRGNQVPKPPSYKISFHVKSNDSSTLDTTSDVETFVADMLI